MDEWHPCEETEQPTQEVLLNFPVDQITWKNLELAVCDIFKQSELNVWNQEKVYASVPDTYQECIFFVR